VAVARNRATRSWAAKSVEVVRNGKDAKDCELGMLAVITLLEIDVAKRTRGNPMEGFFGIMPKRGKNERTRKRMASQ